MKTVAYLAILSSLFGCAYNEVYITVSDHSTVSGVTTTTDRPVNIPTTLNLEGKALGDAIKAVIGLP